MMDIEQMKLLALRLRVAIEEVMEVAETIIGRESVVFVGQLLLPPERAFAIVRGRLSRLGFAPLFRRRNGDVEVRAFPEPAAKRSNPLINLLLLLLTVMSMLYVGALNAGVNLLLRPGEFSAGIPFAASLLTILVVHEFGHYLMSVYHGVKTSLPYFIPAPNLIGTFGAVIKTKSPIPDRKALLDIGAAGPLCGFVVAVVACAVGLSLSKVAVMDQAMKARTIELGDSLLTWFMSYVIKGPTPPGKEVLLHPIAFAGWVGLLITAFNLMPMSQLDGGHISYSILGRGHAAVARGMIGVLLVGGLFWPYWYIWVMLVLILGIDHPPPLDDISRLGRGRTAIGILSMIVFALCIVPVPISA